MQIAKTAQDKKLVLSGLGGADSLAALNLAAKYLNDKETCEEAAMAAAQIGERLRGSKDKQWVKAVLQKVVKTTRNSNTRKRAERTIRCIK
jgi:hypothetical protein